MNNQDYLDALETLPLDVKNYIKRRVDAMEDMRYQRVRVDYLEIIEKDSHLLESIEYLELISDDEWDEVFKRYEEEG
jgi:hypothetical protein|tara:strand:- start:29 stop:259 length:231 start_codon:yes stop_codon:yes gene_type:complete